MWLTYLRTDPTSLLDVLRFTLYLWCCHPSGKTRPSSHPWAILLSHSLHYWPIDFTYIYTPPDSYNKAVQTPGLLFRSSVIQVIFKLFLLKVTKDLHQNCTGLLLLALIDLAQICNTNQLILIRQSQVKVWKCKSVKVKLWKWNCERDSVKMHL